jgi:hypothetical protein
MDDAPDSVAEAREAAALRQLLATPPTPHKPKLKPLAAVRPKKRGRPAKNKP